jgi:hypothetical protein
MYTLRGFPMRRIGLQFELGVNAPNDQDSIFHLDFAHGIRGQTIVRSGDLTRLQRASIGTGKSTCRRGDDVIQRSRSGFDRTRRHLVVLGYRAMHSKNDGLALGWKVCPANRPFHALDSNFRTVHDVGHAVIVAHGLLGDVFTFV